MRLRLALLLLVVIATGASVVGDHLGPQTAAAAARHARPELLSVKYGRVRPAGAPHAYLAVRIRTRYRGGQVVGLNVEQLSPAPPGLQMLDGGCGLAAPKNGAVGVWIIPGELQPGRYRWRVEMQGVPCGGKARAASATRTVTFSVP